MHTHAKQPMIVPAFGIVDCSTDHNHLYAYIYSEKEGNKGANDVVSLIMKFLKESGYLDGNRRLKLTIMCDNCTGQNKNNCVLRLAPYLVECQYFKRVCIAYFVAGHTKNDCDMRFNNMKHEYNKKNCFTMEQLVELCNQSDYVTAVQVNHKVFFA